MLNPVMRTVRECWDKNDAWSSALNALFDVAEVMTAAGVPVPAELEYRHAPGDNRTLEEMATTEDLDGDQTYNIFVLSSEYLAGNVTDRDLTLAALTLNRYADALRAAGLDY